MALRQLMPGSRRRRQDNSSLGHQFTPFPRLPLELQIMIWKIALDEEGSLVILDLGKYYTGPESFPEAFGSREVSPLVLVNQESHLIATSLHGFVAPALNALQPCYRPSVPSYFSTPHYIGLSNDMFYVPYARPFDLFQMIAERPFASRLERLAVKIIRMPTGVEAKFITGQQFEGVIRSLPKLRQLYFVVQGLFGVGFPSGYVPNSRIECARLVYKSCPDHVTSRTALREHIRSQKDDSFGFSDYEIFTRRWQWPIISYDGTLIPFRIYDAFYHRVVAHVLQIADKLQRDIDVKLMVDLDGDIRRRRPRRRAGLFYDRTDIHYNNMFVKKWYEMFTETQSGGRIRVLDVDDVVG